MNMRWRDDMGVQTQAENFYHEITSRELKNEDDKQIEDLRHEWALKNVNDYDLERD